MVQGLVLGSRSAASEKWRATATAEDQIVRIEGDDREAEVLGIEVGGAREVAGQEDGRSAQKFGQVGHEWLRNRRLGAGSIAHAGKLAASGSGLRGNGSG